MTWQLRVADEELTRLQAKVLMAKALLAGAARFALEDIDEGGSVSGASLLMLRRGVARLDKHQASLTSILDTIEDLTKQVRIGCAAGEPP
jgi:hypothetical protein